MNMRDLIVLCEDFFRGGRADPTKTKKPSLCFTDNPDIASVYSSDPKTGNYTSGSRVSKANFEMKNPVDLTGDEEMDLNTVLGQVGIDDPSEYVDDVLCIVYELETMQDRGIVFSHDIYRNMDFGEMYDHLQESSSREDWDYFFNILDYSKFDTYAICDTKTFVRLAKEHGFDGIMHDDVFDAGKRIGDKLLGKDLPNRHVTYRPFGNVKWTG